MKTIKFFILPLILSFIVLSSVAFYQMIFWSWQENYHQNNPEYQDYCQTVDCVSQVGNLYDYLILGQELDKDYYSIKEVNHLSDIKKILNSLVIAISILGIALAILLLYLVKRFNFNNKDLAFSSFIAGDLLMTTGLICYFFFDFLFLQFHLLSFDNDFWLLDPSRDSLIIIFPPELFLFLIVKSFVCSVLISWFIGLLLVLYHKFLTRKPNDN